MIRLFARPRNGGPRIQPELWLRTVGEVQGIPRDDTDHSAGACGLRTTVLPLLPLRDRFLSHDELRIEDRKTKAAEEVVSLAAATDAYEESAEKLVAKMSGLRLSTSTVHRTAEAVGDRLAEERAAGRPVGPDTTWDWLKALEALDLTAAKPDVAESHRFLTGDLGKNLHRTDDPEYSRADRRRVL